MNCPGNKTIPTGPVLLLALAVFALLFSSCSAENRAFSRTLPDGNYRVKESGRWKRAIVYNNEDTCYLLFDSAAAPLAVTDYLQVNGDRQFVRRSFELDVFTFPIKLRPPQKEVPRQMNYHINGNIYLGYRNDLYRYGKRVLAPGAVQRYRKRLGCGAGVFTGLGSVFLNPMFLQGAIPYEYDGVVFTYGAAVIVGYGRMTTGLGLGFDFLTDRYRSQWIYQNKPWLGLVIGLHLR